jgi:hypothetical protein
VDDWFFGLRLETSTNPRSTNVTFGDDSGVNGPFSKDSDRISVGQAYFGYTGLKDFRFTVGRMPNPFVTTSMVWDPDINPEGLAEQWKHTFNFSFGGGGKASGRNRIPRMERPLLPQRKVLRRAISASTSSRILRSSFTTMRIRKIQSGRRRAACRTRMRSSLAGRWGQDQLTKSVYLQLAPTIYNYTGNGDTFNTHFVGDPPS